MPGTPGDGIRLWTDREHASRADMPGTDGMRGNTGI